MLAAVTSSAQSTLTVPTTFPTIQAAINAAANGDIVEVLPGTYAESISFLGKAIAVRSTQGAGVTTIDRSTLGTGITVRFTSGESGSSVLQGFTIANGTASPQPFISRPSDPGGILCTASSPRIVDCVIASNRGAHGISIIDGAGGTGGPGAMACRSGASPTVERCVFRANQGGQGGSSFTDLFSSGGYGGAGAVFISRTSSPSFIECEFTQNRGGNGGDAVGGVLRGGGAGGAGVIETGSFSAASSNDPLFLRCRFQGNSGGGGGAGNTAGDGGAGVFRLARPHAMRVRSCVIAQNAGVGGRNTGADAGAGVVDVLSGATGVVLFNGCTIVANPSGLVPTRPATLNGLVRLENCIVWGNGLPPLAGGTATFSDIEGGFAGSGNVDVDPQFVSPPTPDYRVVASSPVIDAGSNALASDPTDFGGDPRIINATVDMGADESCLEGTMEDLALLTAVNGSGGAECVKTVSAGDAVQIRYFSPGGTLAGAVTVLAAQLYVGVPPASIPGLPEVHLDGGATIVSTVALPVQGVTLQAVAVGGPPGFAGRIQVFAVNAAAANGQFSATRAHDLVLQ